MNVVKPIVRDITRPVVNNVVQKIPDTLPTSQDAVTAILLTLQYDTNIVDIGAVAADYDVVIDGAGAINPTSVTDGGSGLVELNFPLATFAGNQVITISYTVDAWIRFFGYGHAASFTGLSVTNTLADPLPISQDIVSTILLTVEYDTNISVLGAIPADYAIVIDGGAAIQPTSVTDGGNGLVNLNFPAATFAAAQTVTISYTVGSAIIFIDGVNAELFAGLSVTNPLV